MQKHLALSRRAFLGIAGGLLLGAAEATMAPEIAQAAYSTKQFTLAGILITTKAAIDAVSSGAVQGTGSTSSTQYLGAGYYGTYLVMYNDSGTAVGSWRTYNTEISNQCVLTRTLAATSGRSYRSLTYSYVMNSSTGQYDSNASPVWSPYQTAYAIDDPIYDMNDSGLEFGPITGLDTYGYLPDLIQVEGVNGTVGYVYASDFVPPEASDPEDAVANFNTQHVLLVPVYDANGITQIDLFEVGYGG